MSRFSRLEFEGSFETPAPSREAACDAGIRHATGYLDQAWRCFERAEFEPALRYFGRALEEQPGSANAWAGQVRMLIELGDPGEAADWAEKALNTGIENAELLAARGVALARGGFLEEAMALSDLACESSVPEPYPWLARADVLLCRGSSQADYCMEKALSLPEANWLHAWQGARIRLHHRQPAAALHLVRQGIGRDPTRFVLWLERGRCEAQLGQSRAALNSFQHALELEPSSSLVRHELMRLREPTSLSGRLASWWRRLRGA